MALRNRKSTDATSGETASETTTDTTDDDGKAKARADRSASAKAAANQVRSRVAQVIWIICVVAALILAVGALCIALKANADNNLVKFIEDTADKLDFGVFSRGKDGVAHFKGHSHAADTKNALVNWGLAAVVWLVGGRIVERVIRP